MEYLLTIPGTLPGLNEYIKAERSSKYKAAKMKSDAEEIIIFAARKCLKGVRIAGPVRLEYTWYDNTRRDYDNIAFAHKFVQDALVDADVLKDDGRKFVTGFSDTFVDVKGDPRIEVKIIKQ